MSRNIEFRAYDRETKRMYSMNDDEFSNNGIWWLNTKECSDRFFVMQNTNLIDKNKKPIYEGDIVKLSHIKNWDTDIDIPTIGFIEYRCLAIYFVTDEKYYNLSLLTFHSNTDMEILGNMCENIDVILK